jgi:hypothetical protein
LISSDYPFQEKDQQEAEERYRDSERRMSEENVAPNMETRPSVDTVVTVVTIESDVHTVHTLLAPVTQESEI